ncbi:sugar phosphate isomerase/epimerase family protein [Paenibacillus sp. UNC451MF]|uniref:sugar phosphate isomerase/epimerase family protein n=1 Tax=Paenibacillus sp. UNC451MF TaxID=1449063 RepID=UPI0004911E30|nr:sugar phosphate isomerase/epimerase family protein [Paenibacillus sp. UNC451MF]
MSKFILTGFADEIDSNFKNQLYGLNELGIQYIEIRGVDGKNISKLSKNDVIEVRNQLSDFGIQVSSIGSPIGKIHIHEDFNSHLESFKHVIETAHTLSSPFIRIFSFYIPSGEDPALYRDEIMTRLGIILEIAKGSGITILHENESHIYGDNAERCLDIMKTMKTDHFACAFDPANFIQCGTEVFPKALDMLRPYIKYVHIKDAIQDGRVVPAGIGVGRIEEVLSCLQADGYQGFLSLEPHLGKFKELAKYEYPEWRGMLKEDGGLQRFHIAFTALQNILNRI